MKQPYVWTGANTILAGRRVRRGETIMLSREHGKIYQKIGKATPAPEQVPATVVPLPAPSVDNMTMLRGQYESAFGKRPFMGWDAATLRDKIGAYNRRDMRAAE